MTDDPEDLRKRLREGDLKEADRAMSLLLGVDEAHLDPADIEAVLDAMERLGDPERARMFETFLLHVGEYPRAAVPVLVKYLGRSPLSWTGGLAAAAIREVLESVPGGRGHLDRRTVVDALTRAVAAAARTGTDPAAEAVRTLHAWASREPLPEAGPALRDYLVRASEEEGPNDYFLRLAVETLAASGVPQLLEEVRARARGLAAEHPLARVLTERESSGSRP